MNPTRKGPGVKWDVLRGQYWEGIPLLVPKPKDYNHLDYTKGTFADKKGGNPKKQEKSQGDGWGVTKSTTWPVLESKGTTRANETSAKVSRHSANAVGGRGRIKTQGKTGCVKIQQKTDLKQILWRRGDRRKPASDSTYIIMGGMKGVEVNTNTEDGWLRKQQQKC